MTEVTIRELRNKGGDVVERVMSGEILTVTRDGIPVAQLRPLPGPSLSAEVLVERWRRLPAMDPASLRRDIDRVIESAL